MHHVLQLNTNERPKRELRLNKLLPTAPAMASHGR